MTTNSETFRGYAAKCLQVAEQADIQERTRLMLVASGWITLAGEAGRNRETDERQRPESRSSGLRCSDLLLPASLRAWLLPMGARGGRNLLGPSSAGSVVLNRVRRHCPCPGPGPGAG